MEGSYAKGSEGPKRKWYMYTWRTAKWEKSYKFKWIYKIKYKTNGKIERYKVLLITKGFTRLEGVDFHDAFAPVAKLVTVRSLLVIVVKKDWIMHQLDVNNAFLHDDLDKELYMKIPCGFAKEEKTRVQNPCMG